MEPALLAGAVQVAFFGVGAVLAHIDIHHHRLPNAIVAPLAAGLVAAAAAGAAWAGDAAILGRAVAGGVALGAFYLGLRAASRGGVGGGDVKFAVPVGILLAWEGWAAFVLGGALAFVIAGAWAGVLLLARRAGREERVPFGPSMILGAAAGLIAT
ncbi:A24 family peptidase [Microbacterium sp. ZXX196]|uniref:prepilin peptidase n=1 Tax=Microbacterium sp. ZXX196 TaxID=2609291 RepID=UPI0012B8FB9E|nr:A24 family peptidase [Microbacterium sp. ZXX196]